MTWRCVPINCYHAAPHIVAAAFGVLIAAHPQPAGVASCRCHMVWYPDAGAPDSVTRATPDVLPPAPWTRLDVPVPARFVAPAPLIVDAPLDDIPAPTIARLSVPTPVPEPPTWAIFIAAIAALLRVRRRRRSELDRRAEALGRL